MKIVVLVLPVLFVSSRGVDLGTGLDFDANSLWGELNKDCPSAPSDSCPQQIQYWFFTRQNRKGVQLNESNLPNAGFLDRPLKILIHGYWANHTSESVAVLKDGYLDHGEFNIIAVDWGYYTRPACYLQARDSVHAVGRCVTLLLKKVLSVKKFSDVHLLGHSLGAHMTSWISQKFDNPKLNRLTRFDPALPLYINPDEGVADFRDTYHSNTGILGLRTLESEINVYLNSEQFQPGCGCDIACSHTRSVLYFAESIRCGMQGFYGKSWDTMIAHHIQPTRDTMKEIGSNADLTQKNADFLVFGKPTSPFLYCADKYLDHQTFKKMIKASRSDCDKEIKEKIVEEVEKFLKGITDEQKANEDL